MNAVLENFIDDREARVGGFQGYSGVEGIGIGVWSTTSV
jgi:hypothetical protein